MVVGDRLREVFLVMLGRLEWSKGHGMTGTVLQLPWLLQFGKNVERKPIDWFVPINSSSPRMEERWAIQQSMDGTLERGEGE